jgi:hypothetical protein
MILELCVASDAARTDTHSKATDKNKKPSCLPRHMLHLLIGYSDDLSTGLIFFYSFSLRIAAMWALAFGEKEEPWWEHRGRKW